ncbi:glycosyltransferase family 4 protein [Trichloromonas sp.]|uniref:glycosyltransferase family 4 protein n=1 Tax=Trichloromonas sp. TaxID=3069249 RepID=UPI003D81B33D
MTTSKLRILHLVNNFGVGGLESVIRQMALNSSGCVQPYVCVLTMAGHFAQGVAAAGVALHHVDRAKKQKGMRVTLRELVDLIQDWNIDVIHCHDMSSWFYGAILKKMVGKPTVVTKHGNMEKWHWKTVLTSKILSLFTDRIVAVSPEVKADLVKRQFVNDKNIDVIYNGIDLTPFDCPISKQEAKARLGIPENTFVTGTVTRFYPVKNIELQVEAIANLKDRIQDLRHLIVAPLATDYGREIAENIKQRGLDKYICLLGYREDIPQLLQAMDLFVLTSISEGTSMALIEAIAAHLPVVVSNVGGNPNLVNEDVNGFLFDLDKKNDFEEKVFNLYQDAEKLKIFSSKQKDVAVLFSGEGMMRGYLEVYNSICRVG